MYEERVSKNDNKRESLFSKELKCLHPYLGIDIWYFDVYNL